MGWGEIQLVFCANLNDLDLKLGGQGTPEEFIFNLSF